jgi:hypothetical protein
MSKSQAIFHHQARQERLYVMLLLGALGLLRGGKNPNHDLAPVQARRVQSA